MIFANLTGRCANGAESDSGVRLHAIESANGSFSPFATALCGAKPGRRSCGWSEYTSDHATCPRCLKKLAAWSDTLHYERGLGYSEGYKAAREAVGPLISNERVRRDMINCQTPKGYLKENEPYIEVLQATSLAEMYCKIYEAKLDSLRAQLDEAQRGQWQPMCVDCLDGTEENEGVAWWQQ